MLPPSVMIANPTSIFPAHLAAVWRAAGHNVAIVAPEDYGIRSLSDGTPVVQAPLLSDRMSARLWNRFSDIFLAFERRMVQIGLPHYRKATGRNEPYPWESSFVVNARNAFSIARIVATLKPRFVLGQEVAAFGLATALCRNVPRILFPWGGDVFLSAETSPVQYAIIRYALNQADLILPSSMTGAKHIHERFGIAPYKIHAVSWGVDRRMFRRAEVGQRKTICRSLGIDPQSVILLNARRFQPLWGAAQVLEAFLQIARQRNDAHFVLLGGRDAKDRLAEARQRIAGAGMTPRFTIFDEDVSLARCAEIMSVSDVFTSFLGRGDMRSLSVLQAAASGGAPVMLRAPEYAAMEKQGFRAVLLNDDAPEAIAAALAALCDDGARRAEMAACNAAYLARYEDADRQMAMMLSLIDVACGKFHRRRGMRARHSDWQNSGENGTPSLP